MKICAIAFFAVLSLSSCAAVKEAVRKETSLYSSEDVQALAAKLKRVSLRELARIAAEASSDGYEFTRDKLGDEAVEILKNVGAEGLKAAIDLRQKAVQVAAKNPVQVQP